MELCGEVEKYLYHSDNDYSVILFKLDRGCAICTGTLRSGMERKELVLTGDFKYNPKYRKDQFVFSSARISNASRLNSLIHLLISVKGVGPKTASLIVKTFGGDTETTIRYNYPAIASIKGVSIKKAKEIHDTYISANREFEELFNYHLTEFEAKKIYEVYKDKAIDVIRTRPYSMIGEVEGLGFKKVDRIARENGVSLDNIGRLKAAIVYVIESMGDEGHCYATWDTFCAAFRNLIPISEVSADKVTDALKQCVNDKNVVIDGKTAIYAKSLYDAETGCANILKAFKKQNTQYVTDREIENSISETETKQGFQLEQGQKDAIKIALNNRASVITGGPGTGKTTILNAIVRCWKEHSSGNKDAVLLCAPTGKAAKRMTEATGMPAHTIHKLVHYFGSIQTQVDIPEDDLFKGLVIVDESSMIDIGLAYRLLSYVDYHEHTLVLVGDSDQLPPIGPGKFFSDIIESQCIPIAKLQLCHRQTGTIAINAKKINDGVRVEDLDFSDKKSMTFLNLGKTSNEIVFESVMKIYRKLVDKHPFQEIGVIVPLRKKKVGCVTVDDLNEAIRRIVNPNCGDETQCIRISENTKFYLSDRVMCRTNLKEKNVCNGECGFIDDIDIASQKILVTFDSGEMAEFQYSEIEETLQLAYAITVHKSQGSEYKAVIVVHTRNDAFLLQKKLTYTAVTRAKEQVILVGDIDAFNTAISKNPADNRRTKLIERLIV